MPRPCSICTHPLREEIDKAIVSGTPNVRIATIFDVTEIAIRRHKKNGHVEQRIADATTQREAVSVDKLLAYINGLLKDCLLTIQMARGLDRDGNQVRPPDHATKLKAIREARETAKILLEVHGRLPQEPTVNVQVERQWHNFRRQIMEVICFDCRRKITDRLRERQQQ